MKHTNISDCSGTARQQVAQHCGKEKKWQRKPVQQLQQEFQTALRETHSVLTSSGTPSDVKNLNPAAFLLKTNQVRVPMNQPVERHSLQLGYRLEANVEGTLRLSPRSEQVQLCPDQNRSTVIQYRGELAAGFDSWHPRAESANTTANLAAQLTVLTTL